MGELKLIFIPIFILSLYFEPIFGFVTKRDNTRVIKLFIKYSTGMVYAIVLYVRLSVRFHDNSRMSRRRMI